MFFVYLFVVCLYGELGTCLHGELCTENWVFVWGVIDGLRDRDYP